MMAAGVEDIHMQGCAVVKMLFAWAGLVVAWARTECPASHTPMLLCSTLTGVHLRGRSGQAVKCRASTLAPGSTLPHMNTRWGSERGCPHQGPPSSGVPSSTSNQQRPCRIPSRSSYRQITPPRSSPSLHGHGLTLTAIPKPALSLPTGPPSHPHNPLPNLAPCRPFPTFCHLPAAPPQLPGTCPSWATCTWSPSRWGCSMLPRATSGRRCGTRRQGRSAQVSPSRDLPDLMHYC